VMAAGIEPATSDCVGALPSLRLRLAGFNICQHGPELRHYKNTVLERKRASKLLRSRCGGTRPSEGLKTHEFGGSMRIVYAPPHVDYLQLYPALYDTG
jgi:hypothetical protein